MTESTSFRQAADRALLNDDLEHVLDRCFYSEHATEPAPPPVRTEKPDHYKVICISMYNQDLAELDRKVNEL
jgi:hypothetical protein